MMLGVGKVNTKKRFPWHITLLWVENNCWGLRSSLGASSDSFHWLLPDYPWRAGEEDAQKTPEYQQISVKKTKQKEMCPHVQVKDFINKKEISVKVQKKFSVRLSCSLWENMMKCNLSWVGNSGLTSNQGMVGLSTKRQKVLKLNTVLETPWGTNLDALI